jgi:hypothetical protein
MSKQEISDTVDDIFNNMFNDQQRAAVHAIMEPWQSKDDAFVLPIVDGPPGTGKTKVGTIAAAKYLLESSGDKVAYLCFTHFATDWAWRNLQQYGFTSNDVIRLHHNPERTNWKMGIVGCGSDENLTPLSRMERAKLNNCGILLSTLHGSKRPFAVQSRPKIIIDEFSQVSPPMFFTTLYRAYDRNPLGYALLGDPIQLPIITTQPNLLPNIGVYIMKRKMMDYEPHKLVEQYRMHEKICEAVNSIRRRGFHTYPLKTAQWVRDRDLTGLKYKWNRNQIAKELQEILDPANPVVLVNTDECKPEKPLMGSTYNEEEAKFAVRLAEAVHDSYSDQKGSALVPMILSPYAAQVGQISNFLSPALQFYEPGQPSCITIYRSQGREYPCVILSLVRNNPTGFIGFLDKSDVKAQTYVACSRAQAKLIVLLSYSTFLGHAHADFEALYSSDALRVDMNGRVR